ncbi:MAG: CHC2 zinc finger domain-containing protein [candidate division WOR-3 bacterium]
MNQLNKLKLLLLRKFNPDIKTEFQYYIQCPFCDDKKQHLGINFQLNAYHCFRCNVSGNLKKLYNILNSEKYKFFEKIIISTSSNNNNKKKKKDFKQFILDEFQYVLQNREFDNFYLNDYLKNKNLTDENKIKFKKLLKDRTDKIVLYKNRLYFLDDFGQIIQVRLFKRKPKYLTINSNVFYLRNPENYSKIIIVESPFSVLAAEILNFEPDSSIVACLGISNLIKTAQKFFNKQIALFPDKDFSWQTLNKDLPDNIKKFILIKQKNDLFDLLSVQDYQNYLIFINLNSDSRIFNSLLLKSIYLNSNIS